jgi:hypothetical protein
MQGINRKKRRKNSLKKTDRTSTSHEDEERMDMGGTVATRRVGRSYLYIRSGKQIRGAQSHEDEEKVDMGGTVSTRRVGPSSTSASTVKTPCSRPSPDTAGAVSATSRSATLCA